jgi:group II intron reverse transcriptase/maturase
MFEANLEQNLERLMKDLKSRRYQPIPLRRAYIEEGDKRRPLGIPAVRCRVAQEVVRLLLNPIFDPQFHPDSYGYRTGRNCHQALERVLALQAQGYTSVLDADIKRFFDTLSHTLIMDLVRAEVADGNILDLVWKFLRSGVMEDGVVKPTHVGTPQGGVISPLLANIVLNYLDWQLHAQGFKFARYADDVVILCRSHAEAEEALAVLRRIVEDDLGLTLNAEKTKIVRFSDGFEYLGFYISPWTRRMRAKAVERLKTTVRTLTRRSHNLDAQVVEKLNRAIGGTVNYFATPFSTATAQFARLDPWIRMRLRCMKFKRISRVDNRRWPNRRFDRLGLLSCRAQYLAVKARRWRSPVSRGNPTGVARCGKAARR